MIISKSRAKLLASLLFVAILLMQAGIETGQAQHGGSGLLPAELTAILSEALEKHPETKSASARSAAAAEVPTQRASLPDPEFMMQYFINPENTGPVYEQITAGVFQMFPWFGIRSAARLQAIYEADAAGYGAMKSLNDLGYEWTKLWFSIAESQSRIDWYKEQLQILESLERQQRAAYEASASRQSGLMRIRLTIDEWKTRLEAEEFRLIGLKDRFRISAAAEPGSIDASAVYWAFEFVDENMFSADQIGHHPAVQQGEAVTRAAETAAEAARLAFYPSFGLGFEVMGPNASMMMPGNRRTSFFGQLRISIPLSRPAYRSGLQQAQHLQRAANFDREAITLQLQSDWHELESEFEAVYRSVERLKNSLIPDSETTFRLVLEEYSAGVSPFSELIFEQERLMRYFTELTDAAGRLNSIAASMLALEGYFAHKFIESLNPDSASRSN
ncbi:MAG: TolC family protein [Balneolales bacterium]|nr:TolC family protein [Balneolales bacterium]